MTTKRQKLFFILIAVLSVGCSQSEFNSKEKLARYFIDQLNKNSRSRFKKSLMTREYYIREIYPRSNDSKGGLPGAEFWAQFIALQRVNAVDKYFELFRGCQLEVLGIKEAEEVLNEDGVKFHKRIPLNLQVKCGGKPTIVYEDTALLGIVIEYPPGTFSLMNVARD